MKFDIKNKTWEEFIFEDIFDIDSSSSSIDRNKLNSMTGNTPYITRSEKNNGYDSMIGQQADKYNLDEGNVITIGLDTQTVFYQPVAFYTGQNIQVLRSKYIDHDVAQFLIPLIVIQMDKFNWGGNGATLTRLRRSKILLPIRSQGNPDYAFMKAYMGEKEQEKLDKYSQFISIRLAGLQGYKETESLEDKEWGEFYLNEIFSQIQRGKRLKKSDHKKGSIPYVSSTATNNGIDGFIGNQEGVRMFSNCLTLANSGSVGATFYHPCRFVASDHVTKLEGEGINKYVYKFIATLVQRLGVKYSFNREINNTRIEREKIMLPINKDNQPDYEYMEGYIKGIESKMINNYLTTKELVN